MEFNTENHSSYKKCIICLTGGPCGGKTSSLNEIADYFEKLDWKVYCVNETAGILLQSGILFYELHDEQLNVFQKNLIKTTYRLENTFFDLAKNCKKNCLVILDRSVIDGFAYTSQNVIAEMMKENDWNYYDLCYNRYDVVIHFVTAAYNAEKFYIQTDVRTELPKQAKELDLLIAQAWMGHPYFYVINNDTNLNGKIKRAISIISQHLDIGSKGNSDDNDNNLDNEKNCSRIDALCINLNKFKRRSIKYTIKSLPEDHVFSIFNDIDIVYHYLSPMKSNIIELIKKRGRNNCYSYYHTQIKRQWTTKLLENSENSFKKIRKKICHEEYLKLLTRKSSEHYVILIKRRYFIWKGNLYNLDIYIKPEIVKLKNLILLKTYRKFTNDNYHDIKDDNLLPTYLDINEDISDDLKYTKYFLSRKNNDENQILNEVFNHKEKFGHDDLVCT